MNKKDLYKKILFRMKKVEIVEIYFEGKNPGNKDELDLISEATSFVDKMPEEIVSAFHFVLLEKLTNKAENYRQKMEKDDLERIDKLLIEISGKRYDAKNNVGVDLMASEDFEAAEPMLKAAFMSEFKKNVFDKNMPEVFDNYMICLWNLGKYEESIKICRDVISRIDRKSVRPRLQKRMKILALVNMGEALLKQMHYREALGAFMEGYMLDPSDHFIKLGLARYYEAVDNLETVKKLCREILQTVPKSDQAWFQLGMAHIFSGEREEGAKCLIKSYKIDPSRNCTKSNLINCLAELGRVPIPTNCDEWDYIDELIERGEADRIIKAEIASDEVELMREKIEKMYNEPDGSSPVAEDPLIKGAQEELDMISDPALNRLAEPGLIGMDRADVRTFLRGSHKIVVGVSDLFIGEDCAKLAAENAISKIERQRTIKINGRFAIDVQGGRNLNLYDVNNAMEAAFARLGDKCEVLINGHFHDDIKDGVRVVVVINER